MTFSYTRSTSFTIIQARLLSSKVAADMHLCALYYGKPTEEWIRAYSEELAQLLNGGYVEEYEFGYKRNDQRVVCWRYTVQNGQFLTEGRPGKIVSYADVSGAVFYNFLTKNDSWWALGDGDRTSIESSLPVTRTAGSLPSDGSGYWTSDHGYSAGGVGLGRRTYRPSA
jgi:Bacterial HORMA domain family 1